VVFNMLALFTGGISLRGAGAAPADTFGCAPVAGAQVTLRDQGLSRSALVWPPVRNAAQPAPILLLFHGWSSSAEKVAAASGLPQAAAAQGWLVVAPQGSGSPSRWALPRRLTGPDDVAFVERVVEKVARELCGDASRVAAVGFSNGAAFTSLLSCELPLRGIALVSGAGLGRACAVDGDVPVVIAHGLADAVVRVAGGDVLGGRLRAVPLATSARLWRAAGADVMVMSVDGWGHTWPPGVTDAILATFAV
jgi:polyhydroxybutyrate depolymerase